MPEAMGLHLFDLQQLLALDLEHGRQRAALEARCRSAGPASTRAADRIARPPEADLLRAVAHCWAEQGAAAEPEERPASAADR